MPGNETDQIHGQVPDNQPHHIGWQLSRIETDSITVNRTDHMTGHMPGDKTDQITGH